MGSRPNSKFGTRRLDALFLTVVLSGLIAVPLSAQSDAGPGHRTEVSFKYYEVAGETEQEVLRSMSQNGPSQDGRRFFALTESQTGFRWGTHKNNGECSIVNLRVETDVVVTLPKWIDVDSTPSLAPRWRVFETALQNHERWHVGTARQATREIYDALKDISAPDCLLAENRAKQTAQEILNRNAEKNDQYDRSTGHGRSQGASWPR